MTPPLVPPDITIPRLPWVPIYADRLWESNFFAVATDAEFKAAFCLWLKSWHQTPPGSLPTDDRLLCRLAELNGNLAKWGKVKRLALRHWVECDDGRLYHPVIAELILEAAKKLKGKQERMANARAARLNYKGNNQGLSPQDTGQDRDRTLPSGPERAHAREEGFSKNGLKNGAAGSAPMSPKRMGHFDGCTCPNCARWAEQQRSAG